MRVTCPNCAAGYEVPDRLLAAGPKALRCAKCGTTFPAELPAPVALKPIGVAPVAVSARQPLAPIASEPVSPAITGPALPGTALTGPALTGTAPIAPVPEPQAVRVVFHPPMLDPPRLRPRPVGAAWGLAGWVATLVVLAGAGYLLTHDAGKIVAAWPPAARAYAAVGLNPAATPRPPVPPAATAGPAGSQPQNQAPAPGP